MSTIADHVAGHSRFMAGVMARVEVTSVYLHEVIVRIIKYREARNKLSYFAISGCFLLHGTPVSSLDDISLDQQ